MKAAAARHDNIQVFSPPVVFKRVSRGLRVDANRGVPRRVQCRNQAAGLGLGEISFFNQNSYSHKIRRRAAYQKVVFMKAQARREA
jgi:hypothetical protein